MEVNRCKCGRPMVAVIEENGRTGLEWFRCDEPGQRMQVASRPGETVGLKALLFSKNEQGSGIHSVPT